jgi:hypothetical protein
VQFTFFADPLEVEVWVLTGEHSKGISEQDDVSVGGWNHLNRKKGFAEGDVSGYGSRISEDIADSDFRHAAKEADVSGLQDASVLKPVEGEFLDLGDFLLTPSRVVLYDVTRLEAAGVHPDTGDATQLGIVIDPVDHSGNRTVSRTIGVWKP